MNRPVIVLQNPATLELALVTPCGEHFGVRPHPSGLLDASGAPVLLPAETESEWIDRMLARTREEPHDFCDWPRVAVVEASSLPGDRSQRSAWRFVNGQVTAPA